MTNAVIVAGTDTDVGKTVFAAGLTALLDANYWKPIQAGRTPTTDSETVRRLADVPPQRILKETYVFDMPASPHTAAAAEGRHIDIESLDTPASERLLVIETAGGLMVPLNEHTLQIDVLPRWQAPIILCARTALGTINHTLLSIEALKARAVPIIGVAFVGDANLPSEAAICRFGGVRHLGRLPHLSPLNATTLGDAMRAQFDAAALLGMGSAGP